MAKNKQNYKIEHLDMGEYFVVIKTHWESFVDEFVFSLYGPESTSIRQVPYEKMHKSFMSDIFMAHAVEYPF